MLIEANIGRQRSGKAAGERGGIEQNAVRRVDRRMIIGRTQLAPDLFAADPAEGLAESAELSGKGLEDLIGAPLRDGGMISAATGPVAVDAIGAHHGLQLGNGGAVQVDVA